ncbi:M949_RS01915 family surface polysaccharide biosynthesis protein [Aquimarina sediminis]|uniref:M949_RS01915 family surface polysaccharide biosynthesis protein n=1 Tax=Aquimarina sediminis TaxID=2070536 RepID=UPI000FFEA770|nr:hypothetical protein [Aquimarina sediminis]
MNRFPFFIMLLVMFSCGKQTQEPKNNSDQQATKQDLTPKIELNKYDPIPVDSLLIHELSEKEITSTFTKKVKRELGIEYLVPQAYSYKDDSGEYYLILSQHTLNDTIYDKIHALSLSYKNNQFKKKSTVKDLIDKEWETSIWFWNKYSEISDLDHDGLIDVILVYGTTGQDMHTDGRVKIMIYHNKKRITIRHQNSSYGGRLTKINSRFYELPVQIQDLVKEKMKLMTKNQHAAFSEDWEKKMANKATRIED